MLQNRVREYSHSTGTGAFDLDGRIDATFTDFVSAFGDGNPCFYTIINMDALEYEIGRGVVHLGSPNTLTRSVVYESSNGNNPVSFSSGTKQVFNAIPQEFFTTTPTAGYVPKADANNKISNGWLKNTIGYDYFNVITYASSLSIDINNGSRQFITLTGNPTLTLDNVSSGGDVFTLAFKQDGTGGRTVTWFGGITWPGGSPVQPTSTANSITYFDFIRLANGTIYYRPIVSSGGGGGGGGVNGPGSTNIDAVAVWDDTTGTLLRNSLVNIHSSANDKLEYIASFSNIYALTSANLSGAHSDRLLATSDGGFNTWSSTGANLWSVTNKQVPEGSPGTGRIYNTGTASTPIIFGYGTIAYVPTNCTVKLWIGVPGSGNTVGARVYQTLPGAVYNQLFHSSTVSVPVSGGAELDLTMTADNPMVPGYPIQMVIDNSRVTTWDIYAIELDLSTSGGVMTVDMNLADKFSWTLDASRNVQFDNYSVGQRVILDFTQNNTGGYFPTFVNCTIKWNGGHNPFYRAFPNTWITTELLCESIDIYGQPIFVELTRRGSVRYDDRNLRCAVTAEDVPAGVIGLNHDVYLLNSNSTLPDPIATYYGKEVTLINASTGPIEVSGKFYAGYNHYSSGAQQPFTIWSLPAIYDSFTVICTNQGWNVVSDNRRMVFSSEVYGSGNQTIPANVNCVYLASGNGVQTITLPTTYVSNNQIMVVKMLGPGASSGNKATLSGTYTTCVLDKDYQGVVLVFDKAGTGTWMVVSDFSETIYEKTYYSKALIAAADSITGNGSSNLTFANFPTFPAGFFTSVGTVVKFRASGTFTTSASGSISGCGFTLNSLPMSANDFSFTYTGANSGKWIMEGEFIIQTAGTSGKIESSCSSEFGQTGSASVRSLKTTEITSLNFNTTAFTLKPYMKATSVVSAELRTFSVEVG